MNASIVRIGISAVAAAVSAALLAAETNELAEAESSRISTEVSVDFLSCYMWRGQILADAPVWQPAATLGFDLGDYGALSAGFWSSFKLTSRRDGSPVRNLGNQEIDYSVAYSKSFGDMNVEAGHLWYTYPNSDNEGNTEELYLSFSYANDFVTPTVAAYWDYRDNDDDGLFYFNLALAHEFELLEGLVLTPSVSLGLGTDAYLRAYVEDVDNAAFLDQTTGLALTYAVTDWLSLGAQVNYTWIVDPDARHADYMGRGETQRVWGGFNVTFSF